MTLLFTQMEQQLKKEKNQKNLPVTADENMVLTEDVMRKGTYEYTQTSL